MSEGSLSAVCVLKRPVFPLGCRDSLAGLSSAEEVAPALQLTGCYESRRCLITSIYVPRPGRDNLSDRAEVLAEVLNLIGTWSGFLHPINFGCSSSAPAGDEGARAGCQRRCCSVEG